ASRCRRRVRRQTPAFAVRQELLELIRRLPFVDHDDLARADAEAVVECTGRLGPVGYRFEIGCPVDQSLLEGLGVTGDLQHHENAHCYLPERTTRPARGVRSGRPTGSL